MYYPKTKHSKPKNSTGTQHVLASGAFYAGPFIELFNGKLFTGTALTPSSQEIFPAGEPRNEEQGFEQESLNTTVIPPPTERDYQNGKMLRYFLKDKRTSKIVEVPLEQFSLNQSRRGLEKAIVEWKLTGPQTSYTFNGYEVIGIEETNRISVKNSGMIGLEEFITDYSQNSRPTTPQKPDQSPITGLQQTIIIPSPGKKL